MIKIIMMIIVALMLQIAPLKDLTAGSRWEQAVPAEKQEGASSEIEEVTETPPPAPAAAPSPAPAAAPTPVTSYKSDLPEGWQPPPAVPPGAVRLEDVRPGTTKPAPQQLDVPTTVTSAPEPAPAPSRIATTPPPAPAPSAPAPSAGGKSDLPEGWEPPPALPPGAVRIEDIKPGTTIQKPKGEVPPPSAAAPEPAQTEEETMAEAEPVDKSLWDTRNQPPVRRHEVEGLPPPSSTLPPVSTAPTPSPEPEPVTTAVPPPAAPAPAPVVTGHKSDLPEGWEPPPSVPQGAVRIEDIKPGTRPGTQAGAASAPSPTKEVIEEDVTIEEEEDTGAPGKTRQRWGM